MVCGCHENGAHFKFLMDLIEKKQSSEVADDTNFDFLNSSWEIP